MLGRYMQWVIARISPQDGAHARLIDLIERQTAWGDDLYNALISKNRAIIRLAQMTEAAHIEARTAKARANKFACLALLGFGLIAIEAHAVALYLLPK